MGMSNEKKKGSTEGGANQKTMTNDSTLVPVSQAETSIVMPAVSAKEAMEAWKQYQELKENIVDIKVDVQQIDGKDFLKKSYWRKLATFFNLTTEVVEERKEVIGKTIVWHFTVKATAPNGRSAIGAGSCDAFEKATLKDGEYIRYDKFKKTYVPAKPNSIHNIRSTAETRATNRAISNLVGGGEVSAEEVVGDYGYSEGTNKKEQVSKVIGEETNQAKCEYCGTANQYHKKGCPNGTPVEA
jgi:hypothetical protein